MNNSVNDGFYIDNISGGGIAACCGDCELAHLLAPLFPAARGVTSSHPCFEVPAPVVPGAECCLTLEALLPVLPGSPSLPSTHPCLVGKTVDALQPASTVGAEWRRSRARALRP